MKRNLIIGSFFTFIGITTAQNTFPWVSPGNIGIGTNIPNELLDVRGNSTFGGATAATYEASPWPNERLMLLSGNPSGGSNSFGSLYIGSNDAEATNQRLGAIAFCQNVAGTGKSTNAGLKACIRGISSGSGGSTTGFGGNLSFCTASDNSGVILPERMIINMDGNVGIGSSTPLARLYSEGTGNGVAIRGDVTASSGGNATGISANSFGLSSVGTIIGVSGSASAGQVNEAGSFKATGGSIGVTSYGLHTQVSNCLAGGTNYGIYASVLNPAGNPVYNGPTGPNFAGYFNGNVMTTASLYYTSDRNLKKDIKKIDNSLSIISKLNPVNYNFDLQGNPNITLPSEKQYGFISQEIEEILPEFTKTVVHPARLDDTGKELYPAKEILGLNYNGFIALLTKGMQEQQALIEAQQKQLNEQKEMINALVNKAGTTTGVGEINSIPAGYELGQNIPNPFNNETTINYTLPKTVANASLIVYDLSGKQITSFPLTEKGSASITITSEKLAAGIYIYSVMADGKIVDSKRMIVAEK